MYREKSLRDEPDINSGCEVTQQSQHYTNVYEMFLNYRTLQKLRTRISFFRIAEIGKMHI